MGGGPPVYWLGSGFWDNHDNSERIRAAGEPEPETHREILKKLFYETAEMQQCRETADSITNQLDLEDTVLIQIDVPKEFIHLTEFLEEKRAASEGVTPLPVAKVLSHIILDELHDLHYWIIHEPEHYRYYRDLWNRFCEEQGTPGYKLR
jgi:hypothetical protein